MLEYEDFLVFGYSAMARPCGRKNSITQSVYNKLLYPLTAQIICVQRYEHAFTRMYLHQDLLNIYI